MNTSMEAKAQLGYIPEMPAVYDLLTVSEHLEFIRRAYKIQDNRLRGAAVRAPGAEHAI